MQEGGVMGGWEIFRVVSESELRDAWSILGRAYKPPIWERMAGYDAYVAKVAGFATTLLVKIDGQIAGGISFYDNDIVTKRGFITQVMTAPEFQGRGVGTRLLAECQSECLKQGMTTLGLEVRRDNHGARRLYEGCGFAVCGKTETGWLMEKPLGRAG